MEADTKKSSKIINLSTLAFERDKKNANIELTNYFVQKNRQVKSAQLITAMKSSLSKKVFSHSEANKLTDFLSRKFDIRGPAIQYVQAGYLSPVSTAGKGAGDTKKRLFSKTTRAGGELFHQLFLRLQSAVQENLLDYNGARVLVRDIVTSYPTSRDRLKR